jgi:hypothetical protein
MEAMGPKPMGAITVLPAIMLPLKGEAIRDKHTKGKDTRVRAIRDKLIEGRLSDLSSLAGIGPYPLNGMNGSVGWSPVSTLPDRGGAVAGSVQP